MPHRYYTPERLAATGAVCDCGKPAVDYHHGFRCARCKRIEEMEQTVLGWREKARRERCDQGLPEYHVFLKWT